ncbi:MAG: riboflavin biosynthesis protein RibF [Bacteroidales bacterium]|nr:riboflavin biosynthesis protein RibF [Bacteroidales bacterium]
MAVIATGFFDGVHLGHRVVLDALLSEAARRGEQALVISFWPHPRAVLQDGARDLRLLTPQEEKLSLLSACGVDRTVVLPFSREFAAMTAETFISDILVADHDCHCLVVGYDTRMGADRLGPTDIARLFPETVICPPRAGAPVSSTRIRRLLAGGDVEQAAALLGRPYALRGAVVAGNQVGRTIGFPTANMKLYEPLQLIPGVGAYLTEVDAPGFHGYGMTNIDAATKIETHILDFSDWIYGRDLRIRFLERLRDEHRFAGLADLQAQLQRDLAECRRRVASR